MPGLDRITVAAAGLLRIGPGRIYGLDVKDVRNSVQSTANTEISIADITGIGLPVPDSQRRAYIQTGISSIGKNWLAQ